MWWLYLDESGDLGFDFVNKKPSRFFTICILATSCIDTNIAFKRTIKRTIRRKLNPPGKRSRWVEELKATATTLEIKKYAWRMIDDAQFGIYCLTLNKRRVYERLTKDKERIYNYVARLVIDRIPFVQAQGNVQLIVDRSKSQREIVEFNRYISNALKGRVPPDVAIDFAHEDSCNSPGLQLADLFAWGVFQKYELKNAKWYEIFKKKVLCDEQFL